MRERIPTSADDGRRAILIAAAVQGIAMLLTFAAFAYIILVRGL